MKELTEYHVTIDFLHKPTLSIRVKASSSSIAITKAAELLPYPGAMYRNDTSTAITMAERNQQIRDWRKEEAESGNI